MRYVTETPDDKQRRGNGKFQKVTAKKGGKFLMESKLFHWLEGHSLQKTVVFN